VRGSKVTKRACVARGGTLVEAWMGTFDEVDFCPPIYPVSHTCSMKREGMFECSVFFSVVRDKNREDPLRSLSPQEALR
jgi:hypothetical protein